MCLRQCSWKMGRALLALVLFFGVLAAQQVPNRRLDAPDGYFAFKTYGIEQALTNTSIWALAQDKVGFIWIGTEDGLFRFDGLQFVSFGLKDGLPSTFVESILCTDDGEVWIGTRQGLARLAQDAFETVPDLPKGPVTCLAQGPNQSLWIGLPAGLFERTRSGSVRVMQGWPGGSVTALHSRSGGRELWAATLDKHGSRVYRFFGDNWRMVDQAPGMAEERIRALVVDETGCAWARTLKHLYRQDPQLDCFNLVTPEPGVSRHRVDLVLDHQGALWIPTKTGVDRWLNGELKHFGREAGLHWGAMFVALVDREHNLWLASGVGLHKLLCGGAWQTFPSRDVLPDGYVWCVFRDRAKRLYVGCDEGLLRYHGGKWTLVPGTKGFQVRSIAQDRDGTLLLTGGGSILQVDSATWQVTHLGVKEGLKLDRRIFRLIMDRSGTLWVATESQGLLRGQKTRGRWTFQQEVLPDGDDCECINDIHQDVSGHLWVATQRGLALRENGIWRRFTTHHGLLDTSIRFVRSTRQGDLLVAYEEPRNLCRARYEQGTFRVLTHFQGSPEAPKTIYLLEEDVRENVWVGMANGLWMIRPDGSRECFTTLDGLVGNDISNQAFLADPDGSVWIGTTDGLAHFIPSLLPKSGALPQAIVTGYKNSNAELRTLQSSEVRLNPGTLLEVHYGAPSYFREGSLEFETRVLGLDETWRTTKIGVERYTGLKPGTYRFEVRARRRGGDWGPIASMAFRMLPAWWQTSWIRVGLALLGAFLVFMLVRARVRILKRRTVALEYLVSRRTMELAQANQALLQQSLRDPLTNVHNRRYLAATLSEDMARVVRKHKDLALERRSDAPAGLSTVFIMVDIDHFKDVNDHHGHAVGDQVLRQVANILTSATRDTDTVVRWGGEEFFIVARDATRREATILVERIHSLVAMHAFDLVEGKRFHLTCSLGYTFFPFLPDKPDLFGWERIIDLADRCLYAAKYGGRDAWVGLFPTENGDAEQMDARIPGDIAGLLRDEHLSIKSNLTDPARMFRELSEETLS